MDQDWTTVIFKKRKPPKQYAQNETQVKLKKLENEEIVIKKTSLKLRKAIQQARTTHKMSQSMLANKINVKSNVINDYESGKAIPNQQIIVKLEKVLKVKLQGL
jgi:putative transcription factor